MRKKALKIAVGVLFALAVLLWAHKAYRDAHYFDNYDPGAPLPKLTPSQERKVGMVISCLVPLARYFGGVADPIHYAAQISPTPVFFQNGKYDVLVAAAAGKALQDAAKDPKKITWYDSDHVGINLDDTKRVLGDALKWLLEQDDQFRAPEEKVTSLPPFEINKT